MEHLTILSASSRPESPAWSLADVRTVSLYCIDGSSIPLQIRGEDLRRMLHKTCSSLVWVEVDGDPHRTLALIAGDPATARLNGFELNEVEPHERIAAYSRVELVPGLGHSAARPVLDVVNPWVKLEGPAERLAVPLRVDTEGASASGDIQAKDLVLLHGVQLVSDPEQVLFQRVRANVHASAQVGARLAVRVEISPTAEAIQGSPMMSASTRLLQNRLRLCRPCGCESPEVRIKLARSIERGKVHVLETSACCLDLLAEAQTVLAGIRASKRSKPSAEVSLA